MADDEKIDHTTELDAYLRQCVRINPEDIQGEFIRIPGDLAYWNAQYAKAMREHLLAKIDENVLEAQLEPIVRQGLREAGAKITENMVSSAIQSHESLVEAKRRTAEADVAKNECFGYLDSIRSKKDMLISLGAHLRIEMMGDPILRDQMRAAQLIKANDG